jgi:hypothetical protein
MDANHGCAVRSAPFNWAASSSRNSGHRDRRGRHLQPGERRALTGQVPRRASTTTSPTMQSDGLQIAFVGRRTSADSNSIWLLPGAGGDPSIAVPAELGNSNQDFANPQFARTARWLLYNSDAGSRFNPKPWYRNVDNLGTPANRVMSQGEEGIESYMLPAWGQDIDGNGLPDSIVCAGYTFFGSPGQISRGLFRLPTAPEQTIGQQWLPDSRAARRIGPRTRSTSSTRSGTPPAGTGTSGSSTPARAPEHRGPRDADPADDSVPGFCCGRHHDLLRLESGGLLRTERHL